MGGNLHKLQDETWEDHDAINDWEQFIEVVFGANCHQQYYKLNSEEVDEEEVDDLTGGILCEEIDRCKDGGDDDENSSDHFKGSWLDNILQFEVLVDVLAEVDPGGPVRHDGRPEVGILLENPSQLHKLIDVLG